jgi:hypothetical protein
MTKSDIHNKLADIQHQMRAPKNKNNSFGGYSYRNAEGIIAAFKSINVENACLVCRDTLQEVAGQIFVSATAELTFDGGTVSATGHAMHPLQKKGMDASQITGSASSYARKYALCGLFAIEDESQDSDSRDNRQEHGQTPPPVVYVTPDQAKTLEDMATRAGSDRAAIFAALKVQGDTWADLPANLFDRVSKGIAEKLAKMDADHDNATKETDT